MALIPGTLPSDTCYGTPQDLLELFAQYLDVPAFALSSKVVFSTTNTGFTADVIWFDTTSATRPIMKITVSSSGFLDYVKNYITAAPSVTIVGADTLLIVDATDGNTKRGLVSDIVPAAGSVTYPMLSTSATEADNVAKRTIKAWVSFSGSTLTAYSTQSFNVSSIARTAGSTAGGFRINFTTAMSANNYAVLGTVGTGSEVWSSVAAASVRNVSPNASFVDIITVVQSSNGSDMAFTSVAILSA